MKKIILIVFPLVALCCGTVVAQADADKIWDDANTAYINADYVAAIDGYEKLLDSGLESDRLYLNLGNAYFKRGMNGKAILNYNRALKLAPSDDDIRYNLSIANAYVQDKIDAVPVFFAKRWLIGLGNSLSSNAWAALSLLFFALTLVGLGAYLLLRRVALQKGPFVYCFEQQDNGENLAALRMAPDAAVEEKAPAEGLPGNLPELDVNGCRIVSTGVDDAELYADCVLRTEPCTLHAVPYGLWGNRTPGEMRVWVDTTIS